MGLAESVRALNLRANPNIRAAAIRVRENDAVVATDGFSNEIGEVFRGLRQHSSPYGCRKCGLEMAKSLLEGARDEVLPDQPAEFIAFFGYLGHEEEERELNELARSMRDDGVIFIGPDRDLATSDAYWAGGPIPLNVIFRNIEVNFNGTLLRRMALELDLPTGLSPVPYSVQPPPMADGVLTWEFDRWLPETVTLTLQVDVGSDVSAGPRLQARLSDWRGHDKLLSLPADEPPLPMIDGCPQATSPPGVATPSVTPTRVPPTAGPTPTLPGRRLAPAFLPFVVREPCHDSRREMDVALAIDTSSSMRAPGNDSLVEATSAAHDYRGRAPLSRWCPAKRSAPGGHRALRRRSSAAAAADR